MKAILAAVAATFDVSLSHTIEEFMPIFEYKCKTCSLLFEELVLGSMHDGPDACPGCGSKEIGRQASSFATTPLDSVTLPPCGSGCSAGGECGLGGDVAPPSASGGCGCGSGGCHH